jgi:predicted RNA-binding Zn-ribbon protein involved in translation (DUF1610 family)
MSRSQRILTGLAGPGTAAAMEAHSRAWLVRCPNCGHSRSIWELGGIRYKAAGAPRMRLHCPNCGQNGWHQVARSSDFPATDVPVGRLLALTVSIVLGMLILIALIAGVVLKLTGVI